MTSTGLQPFDNFRGIQAGLGWQKCFPSCRTTGSPPQSANFGAKLSVLWYGQKEWNFQVPVKVPITGVPLLAVFAMLLFVRLVSLKFRQWLWNIQRVEYSRSITS
jgi:hypothetical protein